MKKHKSDMIAAWARENKIEGFEQYDPQWQAKNRMRALKWRDKQEQKANKEKSFN